jgi:hypothetical protein
MGRQAVSRLSSQGGSSMAVQHPALRLQICTQLPCLPNLIPPCPAPPCPATP